MKMLKHIPVIQRLLLGALSLLTLGLVTACGSYPTTALPVQNTPSQGNMSLQGTQAFTFPREGTGNNQTPLPTYPDPTNQSSLPASVKVTRAGDTVLLQTAVAEGYQIYECQASTTSPGGFAWKLQAPFAILKANAGSNVIHSTGPTWLYTQDGSEIRAAVGKFTSAKGVVAASTTPDPTAVAWLRLDVTEHHGTTGLFSHVDQVQRLYTHNGIAPSNGCNQDAASHHVIQPVSYTAEYVFWGQK